MNRRITEIIIALWIASVLTGVLVLADQALGLNIANVTEQEQ